MLFLRNLSRLTIHVSRIAGQPERLTPITTVVLSSLLQNAAPSRGTGVPFLFATPRNLARVDLVHLVYLVGLVQPNKQDRPNRPNEQGRLILLPYSRASQAHPMQN